MNGVRLLQINWVLQTVEVAKIEIEDVSALAFILRTNMRKFGPIQRKPISARK